MTLRKVFAKRILVVDDDGDFGQTMAAHAHGRGVALDAVGSRQLLGRLEAVQHYDLVVLDYDLDAATGLEIAEFLNHHLPSKPLVMMSTTARPWQDEAQNTPNIRSVASKWDGVEAILEAAIKAS